MSETPPSPDPSKTEPDPSYLSFANPNYCLDGEDQPHDLQSPLDDDDPLSFGRLSVGEANPSNRRAYANSDYSSGDVTPSSPDRSFILQKLSASPSDKEEEGDTDDDTSSLEEEDDSEMTHNLLGSQEELREEATYQPIAEASSGAGAKKSRGILGYLAMLEQQAKGGPPGGGPKGQKMVKRPDAGHDGEDELDGPELLEVGGPALTHKLQAVTDINSPDSHDSGIQSDIRTEKFRAVKHVHGPLTDDIYAIVEKTEKKEKIPEAPENKENVPENEQGGAETEKEGKEGGQEPVSPPADVLPPGWEKHEDEDGAYYWHIKSGTIQRDPPPPAPPDGPSLCTTGTVRSVSVNSDSSSQDASSIPSTPTSITSNTERHLQEFEGHALQYAAKSLQSMASEQKPQAREENGRSGNKPERFAVRSLGWVSIAEDDLTPERSSKAVNKCIMDLSLGRNHINDTVGRWGHGKDLYMDIDSHSLRLIDPADFSTLNSQAIHSIRVWGVGRDNGRDFAYVARDKASRMHMCHVFQCDTPARQIANTLRDICKRIMQERGLHHPPPSSTSSEARVARPTDLPNLDKSASIINSVTFPTPMEEPRKVMRCHYLGSHEVIRPTGTDIVNESVEWMYNHVPAEKWTFVNVAIAPSTITITEHGNPDNILEECRVRFMSFMGISITSVKLCAFVMHTAQNKFMSHVFHCEPSAGPMCKTIEAACKLRYQKCLDAHPQTPRSAQNGKGVGAALKAGVKASVQGVQSIFGMIKAKAGHGGTGTGTANGRS